MSVHKVSLKVIDVAEPCTVPWEELSGDDVSRHCAHCKLDVYDLSAMTRTQAERFLADSGGAGCVRFVRRADGTVVTRDCENAWRRAARRTVGSLRRGAACAGSVVAAVIAFGVAGGRAGARPVAPVVTPRTNDRPVIMGRIGPATRPGPATQPDRG